MAYTTIDDPSAHFQTALWSGNDSTQSITNDGNSDMQPDWVWIKRRDGSAINHQMYDSSRGVTKNLVPNVTQAEGTRSTGLTAFNSDGFSLGAGGAENASGNTFVGWQWKANGGTTSSNSDGDITSTVQANTTAGFSIVTYAGNGNDGDTVGHGLSGNWDLCILKNRGETDYWTFSTTGTNQVLLLHDNVNQANHSTAYMTKASGVIGLVNAGDLGMVNNSSENYVAYVFKEVQGYSKFGNYTGNGNADGAFVYTGFKPAWLLGKRTDGIGNSWFMFDTKRDTENVMDAYLYANETSAETTGTGRVDFLSNGFKWRNTAAAWNGSGNTYVYMAFAEHPFVSSKGVPVTAR
jgi:hypothetical protein